MKNLSYLVIFVALATLFVQSSGNEKHIRSKILKAHDEAKERLAPSGKSKSNTYVAIIYQLGVRCFVQICRTK